ncbi:hypothetical protein ACFVFS_17450 [Kitasatospora sp. NPDC057692]|uniref:hypothetical protein n=1 Tax=Kitasatospora sp. NPDC057692 TaxID=3346215 RepID=UPI0036B90617
MTSHYQQPADQPSITAADWQEYYDTLVRVERERCDALLDANTQRARADHAESALTLLHQGEEPYKDERTVPTPAQWMWRWNRVTSTGRMELATRVLADGDKASTCFVENHRSSLSAYHDRAEQAEAHIATLTPHVERLLTATGRMHEHWADATSTGNTEWRNDMWQELHRASDTLAAVLAGEPLPLHVPDGACGAYAARHGAICARPAGHPKAYHRDAKDRVYWLADDTPATGLAAAALPLSAAEARIAAVRALHQRATTQFTDSCTHCSEHDYPDYDVAWPCPTITALDGTEGATPVTLSREVDGQWQTVPGVTSVEPNFRVEAGADEGTPWRVIRHHWDPVPGPTEAEVRARVRAILAPVFNDAAEARP